PTSPTRCPPSTHSPAPQNAPPCNQNCATPAPASPSHTDPGTAANCRHQNRAPPARKNFSPPSPCAQSDRPYQTPPVSPGASSPPCAATARAPHPLPPQC